MLKLNELRRSKGESQQDIADFLGVSRVTYTRYENGSRKPDFDTISKLADYFGVSTDYLLGIDKLPKRAIKKRWVPILGWILAGPPVISDENIIGYVEMPEDAFPNDELFSLIVEGESMSPYYLPGDIVIYRVTNLAENGDDVAVRINGDEFTLKRYKRTSEGVMLVPLNQPEYEPMFFTNAQIESLPVEILGVVVEQRRTKQSPKKIKRK